MAAFRAALLADKAARKAGEARAKDVPAGQLHGRFEDTFQLLLKHGAAIDFTQQVKSHGGFGMMHLAAAGGSARWVAWLLVNGAAVDLATVNRRSPLMIATSRAQIDCMVLLLDGGASLSARDGQGRTVLHHAAVNGSAATVQLLLIAGCDKYTLSNDLETAGDLAEKAGHRRAHQALSIFKPRAVALSKRLDALHAFHTKVSAKQGGGDATKPAAEVRFRGALEPETEVPVPPLWRRVLCRAKTSQATKDRAEINAYSFEEAAPKAPWWKACWREKAEAVVGTADAPKRVAVA